MTTNSEYLRQRYLDLKSQGLCPQCKNPARPDKVFCENCQLKMTCKAKEIREARKSQGLCWRCGDTSLPGKGLCMDCNQSARKMDKAARNRAKEAGKCITCFRPNDRPEMCCCSVCAARKKTYQHQPNSPERKHAMVLANIRYKKKRMEKGLCSRCGEPNSRKTWNCIACNQKDTPRQQTVKKDLLSRGKCIICREEPHRPDRQTCESCGRKRVETSMKSLRKKNEI